MKKHFIVSVILTLIFLVTGCSQPQQPGSSLVLPDSRGVEITFDKIPESVVSLAPANTEILYALNAGDKIIAVSEYCNYPEEIANKTKLPTGEKLDIENLIALKPDLVITGYMSAMEDQFRQLETAGIKVFVTEANSLSETYETIEAIGKIIGKEKEADTLIKNMKDGFDNIIKEVEGKASPTIYVEVSPLEWGLWTCGKNTFIQELIDIVGARNIFEDVEGWAEVSEEQVISKNPDFIVTTSSPLTGIEDPIGEISSRANWSGLDAVKNSRIMMLESDMITRPGPRLLDAAKELTKILYD
ncbi:MAG: ABC transporter substrate-binding protein [Clostridiaceae bacterium]|jgi:iron complex transport system substrate-binding protein|nr:ABC transporter substrate-binding protein [Clostridiaceae bacterium]